jgi:hypothetical protein
VRRATVAHSIAAAQVPCCVWVRKNSTVIWKYLKTVGDILRPHSAWLTGLHTVVVVSPEVRHGGGAWVHRCINTARMLAIRCHGHNRNLWFSCCKAGVAACLHIGKTRKACVVSYKGSSLHL